MVASEAISQGIVGLVAARLVERYYRPSIAMQIRPGDSASGMLAVGSCRSIAAFDITALLRRNEDLFERYGGHRAAAGFSLDAARLTAARERLIADAGAQLTPEDLTPTIDVEAELPLGAVNGELLRWLNRLGPHGQGNPTPRFLGRGVRIEDSRAVGQDGSHLQFTLREGRVTWRANRLRQRRARRPRRRPRRHRLHLQARQLPRHAPARGPRPAVGGLITLAGTRGACRHA